MPYALPQDRYKRGGTSLFAPVVTEVLATAATQPSLWFYTTSKPAENWSAAAFEPKGWKEGKSGFGMPGTPGTTIGTNWSEPDI